MSYEINIIAVNQIKPIHMKDLSIIILQNEIEHFGVNRYAEIWPFFSSTQGILYSLVTEIQDGLYNALELCDSNFEVVVPDNLLPSWISEDIRENLTPFIVKENVYKEFISILKYLLENAPQKKILFQTRYQGGDEEIVFGVIRLSHFIDMLNKNQVLFNVCYIITK
ncbi:MAG: hypothetical protein HDR22_08595 [Lachnospiraceae bacterium]|nr:hypothetical protein [Lachnospiraceae bacterium]